MKSPANGLEIGEIMNESSANIEKSMASAGKFHLVTVGSYTVTLCKELRIDVSLLVKLRMQL